MNMFKKKVEPVVESVEEYQTVMTEFNKGKSLQVIRTVRGEDQKTHFSISKKEPTYDGLYNVTLEQAEGLYELLGKALNK